jgi:hypothetical protein
MLHHPINKPRRHQRRAFTTAASPAMQLVYDCRAWLLTNPGNPRGRLLRVDSGHRAGTLSRMHDLAPLPLTAIGRYRHYKGGEYEVLGAVRHSETTEPLVLYLALYGERGLWVRPHAMFFENIETDGVLQPRFARVA